MGTEISKSPELIIPESCTLENLKERRQFFEKKIKEFDDRLAKLDQTVTDQREAGAAYQAKNTLLFMKQIIVVRAIYVKILPELTGSILLVEETEPLIALLKMLPHSETVLVSIGERRAVHMNDVFSKIRDILIGSISDMSEVCEVVDWKEEEGMKNGLIILPPATTTMMMNHKVIINKDKAKVVKKK